MTRIAPPTLLLFGALLLAGCDRKSSASRPPQPGAKPGHLIGKLADAQGKPLSNVTIRVFGFSDKGEPVKKEVKIAGPAGEYDIALPDGRYDTPTGRIEVNYDGRAYNLPLAAADNTRDWPEQGSAAQGMVRDFVWRISGKVPGGDALEPGGYWGGTIVFDKGADLGEVATMEITFTPDGPLIDGSPGKPLTYVRKLPWARREDHYLFDLPIGNYNATARIVFGGKPKALRMVCYTIDPTTKDVPSPGKVALKVPVVFECQDVKKGTWKLLMPNLTVFPPQ